MNILAIESSCDETSAAVVSDSRVLSNIISSQYFHGIYGGVVPELASRAHIKNISLIVKNSLVAANLNLNDIDALAVTSHPGLVGSLIVGANFAKGLALRYNLPIVPVNHIEGHIFSGDLQDKSTEFPYITLVISGGHTALFMVQSYSEYYILGSTLDDAAGEAFDKIGTLFGLQYPGGPQIDKLAKLGNKKAFQFPRSMINSGDYHFSFSGLKTSVKYFIAREYRNGIPENIIPDLCASVQEAIVEVLVKKSVEAALNHKVKSVVVGGGVSANSRLREKLNEIASKAGLTVILPDISYCMDNAAMIGFIAEKKLLQNPEQYNRLDFRVDSTSLRKSGKERKREENFSKSEFKL